MRSRVTQLLVLMSAALGTPALGGIVVTQSRTTAVTLGYAPFSQTEFYAKQELIDISPAHAQVSGDWWGPNAGGTTPTWHWVGAAEVSSTTTFDYSRLSVTGSGSFSHELTTTAGFIYPGPFTYTPSSTADNSCFFTLTEPAFYSVSVELGRYGVAHLGSVDFGTIFDRVNFTTTPVQFEQAGTLAPGRYRIQAGTGVAIGNLPNGVNHYSRAGYFSDFRFAVQVPEPNAILLALFLYLCAGRREVASRLG